MQIRLVVSRHFRSAELSADRRTWGSLKMVDTPMLKDARNGLQNHKHALAGPARAPDRHQTLDGLATLISLTSDEGESRASQNIAFK